MRLLSSSSSWLASFLAALLYTNPARAQGNLGGDQSSCNGRPGWVHKGCYDDTGNGRHANFKWLFSSSATSERYYPGYTGAITVEFCLTACRGHGFRYAALYAGNSCYCASTLPNPDPPTTGTTVGGPGALAGSRPGTTVANSVCNAPCAGNASQTCGSPAAANVFQDLSFTNSTDAQAVSNYGYVGCYNNINPGPMFHTIRTVSTVSCQTYCAALGYAFSARSGTDSSTGTTCGCGTEIQSGLQIAESSCSNYCNGSSGASCVSSIHPIPHTNNCSLQAPKGRSAVID